MAKNRTMADLLAGPLLFLALLAAAWWAWWYWSRPAPAKVQDFARLMAVPALPARPDLRHQGRMLPATISERDVEAARKLLAPAPVFSLAPLTADQASRKIAQYVLFDAALVVMRNPRARKEAWVLRTIGRLSTPPVRLEGEKKAKMWRVTDPTILVGVEGGKVQGLEILSGAKEETLEADAELLHWFAYRTRVADPSARDVLPPAEPWPQKAISEEESERRTAAWLLHLPDLKVVDVLPGEPDGTGKQREVRGRWTLGTIGGGGTPLHIVKPDTKPSSVAKVNSDIVVEVRGGKIIGLRTELCLR